MSVVQVGPEALSTYAGISIAFEVRSRLAVEIVDRGLGGIVLREEPVDPPYVKDYDADGTGPAGWKAKWPISNRCFLMAYCGTVPVGAAALALESPGVDITDRYPHPACLWDIRVQTAYRSNGIGSMLLSEAERAASERGYRKLHVETQNVNVPACRFYRAHGFRLFSIDLRAYPDLPHEAMLLWEKDI